MKHHYFVAYKTLLETEEEFLENHDMDEFVLEEEITSIKQLEEIQHTLEEELEENSEDDLYSVKVTILNFQLLKTEEE